MKKYQTRSELPLVMNAEDVQDFLGISRAGAYMLMHSDGFPLLKIQKRMLVPREKFLDWVDAHTNGNELV